MKRARRLAAVFFAAGFLAAGSASAQFVHLSRCHAAFPCSIPFGLQYSPDPLIAGPFADVPNTAVSGRIELATPLKFEVDRPIDQKAVDEAIRKTLEIGRTGKPAATMPAGFAPAAPPPAGEPKNPPPKS